MKAKVSSQERVQSVCLKKYIRSVLAMLILVFLVPELAYPENGAIRFRGSLVHASCDARPASQQQVNGRVINVAPQVALDVSTLNNACSQSTTPFTTRYQALPVAGRTVDTRQGVVILTYD